MRRDLVVAALLSGATVLLVATGCGAAKRPLAYDDLNGKVGVLEFKRIKVDNARLHKGVNDMFQSKHACVELCLTRWGM